MGDPVSPVRPVGVSAGGGTGEQGPPGVTGPPGPGAKLGLVDGRPLVATGLARVSNGLKARGASSLVRHVITSDCSDLRFWYAGGLTMEGLYDPVFNPVRIKVGVWIPGIDDDPIFKLTFRGREFAELGPGGAPIPSDPFPRELQAGTELYTRAYAYTPFGPVVSLAAAANINDPTLQLSALPRATGWALLDDTNPEWVEIVTYSGTTAPFTAVLASPLTKAHAINRTIGQQIVLTTALRKDLDEGYALDEDLAHSGTFDPADMANGATTLAAPAAANDTIISVTNSQFVNDGPLLIGSGGGQETVDVHSVQLASRVHLADPLAGPHAAGAPVASTALSSRYGLAPVAITADRTPAGGIVVPSFLGVGDSIMRGAGTLLGLPLGFADRAADVDDLPFINIGKNAEQGNRFVTDTGNHRRRSLYTVCDWAIEEYSNDLDGAGSAAGLLALKATVWALATARGLRLATCTILPRPASTDFGMTVGNQTADPGREPIRVPYNDTLRDWVADWDGPITRFGRGIMGRCATGSNPYGVEWVIDIAHAIESAVNSGLWRVDGGPYSDCGQHPNGLPGVQQLVHPTVPAGHQLIADHIDLTLLLED